MDILRDIGPYLGLAVVLVLVSVFFSGTEVALFALRRTEREQMSRSKRRADQIVLAMLTTPRRLIATVLIGNELAGATIAAICVHVLGTSSELADLPRAALAVAITVPVVVLIGAVMAKTLALKAPMGWSRVCGPVLQALSVVIAPARWIVSGLSEVMLRPIGQSGRPRPERDLSEEEFRTLVDAGSAQGQVDARERRIIHRVFEFGDKTVGQVMTPRDKIVALAYDLPMSRMAKEAAARGFSRVPIYQRSLDNVRGVLNSKDLVAVAAGQAKARTLGELLHEPLFVPRTTLIKRLFRTFKQKKVHLAMVVNEYGKVLGLVTMDDLLAQLFGKLRDERDALQRASAGRGRADRTPLPGTIEQPAGFGVETGPIPLSDQADLAGEAGLAEAVETTGVGDELPEQPSDGSGIMRPAAEAADAAAFASQTPRRSELDPIARAARLHSLSSLEDEHTPMPVNLIDVIARAPGRMDDDSDGTPSELTDASTGPSGPVTARREERE